MLGEKAWSKVMDCGVQPQVIAEVGINHGGSVDEAMRLMDLAQLSGADMVKLQCFNPDEFVSTSSPYFELFKSCKLNKSDIKKLFVHAERQGIVLFASVFDETNLNILEDVGCQLYKIASGDITHHTLISSVAKTGKPVIVSNGCSTLNETLVVKQLVSKDRICILHCVSNYPAEIHSLNLRSMDTVRKKMGVPVGFSDHTNGITAAIVATALGARLIEKHFTSDKANAGPDHSLSADPTEFKNLVRAVSASFYSLGSPEKSVVEGEDVRLAIRRSMFASKNLKVGDVLKDSDILYLRPGTGLCASNASRLIGKRINQNINAGDEFRVEMFHTV